MRDQTPDPAQVHTVPELISALQELRAGRSYTSLNKTAAGRLPKSTVSDLLTNGRPTAETLEVFLRACQAPRETWRAWQQARERALSTSGPVPAGLIRVSQADPRRLGVHAAIDAPGAQGDLPTYVERDTDTAPNGVRALISKAAADGRGGLVVLVGSSSVGKTRSAYEAINLLLPTWWLAHPADAGDLSQIAADPPARLVVWLDELQRLFEGPEGLQASTVRRLLGAGAVLVASLWSERYDDYVAKPQAGALDAHADAREVLGLAHTVRIDDRLSAAEHERAQDIAQAGDARIALALESKDYGLTQVIAAAPQLIDRWKGANPYTAAVLNAAIDATRLGVTSPLQRDLLEEAAPGYCDPRQRAKAPTAWFEAALAYLSEELNGAASALAPVAPEGVGMGQVVGYVVADYLQQYAGQARRRAKVPETCWQALVHHLTDPADQLRVGRQARNRLLLRHAEPLFRGAIRAGKRDVTREFASLLVDLGQEDEARAIYRKLAQVGDEEAARRLAKLGESEEALEALYEAADHGDELAMAALVDVLVDLGRSNEAMTILRERKESAGELTLWRMSTLLVEVGEGPEAMVLLSELAAAGSEDATRDLAKMYAGVPKGMEVLQDRARAGDEEAVLQLPTALAALVQARERWREQAQAGDRGAVRRSAVLLAALGQVEEALSMLRQLAREGDEDATRQMAEVLAKHRKMQELRTLARTGEKWAILYLSEALGEMEKVDEALEVLQELVEMGDLVAEQQKFSLLLGRGQIEEAIAVLRKGAEAGSWMAAWRLADLLASLNRIQELRDRAALGDEFAGSRLLTLLTEQGRFGEVGQIRRHGLDAG
ncbi:hypothetical protein HTZ77_38980 [Nonomuraea sp. SMC257]|uniref:Tetratricopeptide repeat protein n=1 Tax=Nonomuraea montanisoli TaxID=2741721 RepID=A0A7Y6IFW0_9ACTN|nr:hypothetical protein [Nonomuraea montanisoli]NUW37341.1 hypothetical protein [Nonomuraea montanisoli]